MDSKLAKGYTREGFRKDLKSADGVSDEMLDIVAPYLMEMRQKGKLAKERAKTLLDVLQAFKSSDHITLFLERFRHPRLGATSTQFEGAIAGGNFSPMQSSVLGIEEKARFFSLFYDRCSRHDIELRTLDLHVYIREHAISRFLERGDGTYKTATRALWPGFLIIAAVELVTPVAIARPFMLPATGGAFLCVAVRKLGRPDQIQRIWYDGRSTKGHFAQPHQAAVIPMTFINTFIADEQMTSQQAALKRALSSLIEAEREMLLFALLARIMIVDGDDRMGLDGALKGDIEKTLGRFNGLVSSPIWAAGVRAPQDGQFVEFFRAQGMLERSAASLLQ